MVLVIVADVLIILTAALGIYGVKKANACLLFLFTVLVGIFCVVLIVGGILAAVAPSTMLPENLCTNTSNTTDQWYQDVLILEISTNVFCTSTCPCNLTDLSNYTAF